METKNEVTIAGITVLSLIAVMFVLGCYSSANPENWWPDGFDCGVAVILHTDSVLPDGKGEFDLDAARENIARMARLLDEFPQIKVTAAFPTSESAMWRYWRESGVEFAEIAGHSHTHHASIFAATFGDDALRGLDGVYFDELPDLVFDADYAMMNTRLDAIDSSPRLGYIAPNLRYTPHIFDVLRRDGAIWYTTTVDQPSQYGGLVDLGWSRNSLRDFPEDCAAGRASVVHFHTYNRGEISRESLQILVETPRVWFASAGELAESYLARSQ